MEEPHVGILEWATQLVSTVMPAVSHSGQRLAFWQVYGSQPERPEFEPEMRNKVLDIDDARASIGYRIGAGFTGIAGAICLCEEEGKLVLRMEGFDTRSRRSISAYMPMKKTWSGKLQPVGNHLQIDGIPGIPGVFEPPID